MLQYHDTSQIELQLIYLQRNCLHLIVQVANENFVCYLRYVAN